MAKKLTTQQKKVRWAKQAIRKNPSWGRDRLNKELKSRYGSGIRKQQLSDIKHIVLHTAAKSETARERIFEKRISKSVKSSSLRVPSDVTPAPRLDHDIHRRYAVPINKMPRPDLPRHYFADIEFPIPVDVTGSPRTKGYKKTSFVSVRIGTMSRNDFVIDFRTGAMDRRISKSVLKDFSLDLERIDYSIVGYWATKNVVT